LNNYKNMVLTDDVSRQACRCLYGSARPRRYLHERINIGVPQVTCIQNYHVKVEYPAPPLSS
jgi:hypothetical protein